MGFGVIFTTTNEVLAGIEATNDMAPLKHVLFGSFLALIIRLGGRPIGSGSSLPAYTMDQ